MVPMESILNMALLSINGGIHQASKASSSILSLFCLDGSFRLHCNSTVRSAVAHFGFKVWLWGCSGFCRLHVEACP